MADSVVRAPDEFEAELRSYIFERSEEARAVRVGEKDVSEQAAIVARHADLFSTEQLESLHEAEESVRHGDQRERLYRLKKACEDGLLARELVELQDALESDLLAVRVDFRGESVPLRSAQARLAVLDSYEEREELGELQADASTGFNERRLEIARAGEELSAKLTGEPDPVVRTEDEKGVSLRQLADALAEGSALVEDAFAELRERWLERLLGAERPPSPASYHLAYVRRLSPLEDVYTKERATEICLATLQALGFDLASEPNIRSDLEDRPQKAPRPCVIASDPPTVVHLITRAQGGMYDYAAFLHEAGHALHYAGCDPELPYAFRALGRDHALTEIYSFLCESITREPEWHAAHFGLSDEQAARNAEASVFLHALLFRRYVAKLHFELDFWSRFAQDGGTAAGYADRLTDATGFVFRSDGFIADMDAGFYSADYLRAWIRSAQLREYLAQTVGVDWWRRTETGDFLRGLFQEGLKPSSEDVAARIDYNPLDLRPLLAELHVNALRTPL